MKEMRLEEFSYEDVFKVLEAELSYDYKLRRGYKGGQWGTENYIQVDLGAKASFQIFIYTRSLNFVPNFIARAFYYNTFKELEQRIRKICIKNFTVIVYPGNADSYIRRGLVIAELGYYDEAIKDFTKAIEIDPQNAASYHFRSKVKMKLQDYTGAKSDYKRVVEIDPEFLGGDANEKYPNEI